MTDHLATGMKRMIRAVARSASLFDRLGERSRLLRLTGNRSQQPGSLAEPVEE